VAAWSLASLFPGLAARPSRARPLTERDIRGLYQRPESFTDLLPWTEYLPEHRCFLLEDGVSVGALWELAPACAEARTEAFMAELQGAIQSVLIDALPEEQGAPWVLQLYVQDEPSLAAHARAVADYVCDRARPSAFTKTFLEDFERHLRAVSRPGGLFRDTAVTGTRWSRSWACAARPTSAI